MLQSWFAQQHKSFTMCWCWMLASIFTWAGSQQIKTSESLRLWGCKRLWICWSRIGTWPSFSVPSRQEWVPKTCSLTSTLPLRLFWLKCVRTNLALPHPAARIPQADCYPIPRHSSLCNCHMFNQSSQWECFQSINIRNCRVTLLPQHRYGKYRTFATVTREVHTLKQSIPAELIRDLVFQLNLVETTLS